MPKRKLIALLLNMIVCPGTGQIYLKKKKMGYSILGLTILVLVGLIGIFEWGLYKQFNASANAITNITDVGKILSDTWAIQQTVYYIGLASLLFLWVFALVQVLNEKETT